MMTSNGKQQKFALITGAAEASAKRLRWSSPNPAFMS